MTDLPKLDTREAVREFIASCASAHSSPMYFQHSPDCLDPTRVAAYLAECVRLRQAFEQWARTDCTWSAGCLDAECKIARAEQQLRDAMKGDGDPGNRGEPA